MRRIVLTFALALSACDADASQEARMFLDRLDRLDIEDPVEDREQMVDNLSSLPLANDEVRSARDTCVQAHRALLETETRQRRAAQAVAEYPRGTKIPLARQVRIQQDIEGSNAALARSRRLFRECIAASDRLRRQYRRRS